MKYQKNEHQKQNKYNEVGETDKKSSEKQKIEIP